MMYRSIRHAASGLSLLPPLLLVLLLSIGTAPAAVVPQPGDFQGCPEPGQGGDPDLNRLKNRSAQVATT